MARRVPPLIPATPWDGTGRGAAGHRLPYVAFNAQRAYNNSYGTAPPDSAAVCVRPDREKTETCIKWSWVDIYGAHTHGWCI